MRRRKRLKIKRKNLKYLLKAVEKVLREGPWGGWKTLDDWDRKSDTSVLENLSHAHVSFIIEERPYED